MLRSVADIFWQSVAKSDDKDGCWIWTGKMDRDNYGRCRSEARNASGYRKEAGAHRVSWELHHGPIPKGMCVLHSCDNPSCVRPDHLFLGTHADNMRDAVLKGRHDKSKRTHCPQGHPYSGDNLLVFVDHAHGFMPHRACLACREVRRKERYADAGT